jgi:hypothetical protein
MMITIDSELATSVVAEKELAEIWRARYGMARKDSPQTQTLVEGELFKGSYLPEP